MKGDVIPVCDEVMFRQIHPASFNKGEPGSDRFRPSFKDDNKLSVDRSSLTSAEAAHALFVGQGRMSAAVFGVSVREFQACAIPCVEDQIEDGFFPNAAHALGDYSSEALARQKVISKRLKRDAINRGCIYAPATDGEPQVLE
jgi:hypothetical protein